MHCPVLYSSATGASDIQHMVRYASICTKKGTKMSVRMSGLHGAARPVGPQQSVPRLPDIQVRPTAQVHTSICPLCVCVDGYRGKMSKGGVAALECVSLELKSQVPNTHPLTRPHTELCVCVGMGVWQGKYVCRQLSFADVQFSVTQVEPSQELTDRYTQFAK